MNFEGTPTMYSEATVIPSHLSGMFVVKRSGRREVMNMDKVRNRIESQRDGLAGIMTNALVSDVEQGVHMGVSTDKIDELIAQTAASMATWHSDYSRLAARIEVSRLHKVTEPSFVRNAGRLRAFAHPQTGKPAPLIAEDVYQVVVHPDNAARIEAAICYERDFDYEYFGFKTLQRSYLLRLNGKVAERPQQMLMRVALGIHKTDVDAAIETYDLMSRRLFTHATPTLFNAGTPHPQMSSCFLLQVRDDSIEGIYDTMKSCATISKFAGGIGVAMHNVRATGSYIRGSNGTSNGVVPMLRVFNDTARYVDQGGGKRKGSFAMYLEPWHADIFEWLDLRKNHGNEHERARDLFYGLWIPDLFMERVESGGEWSLFCPDEAPGLHTCYGDAFAALYTKYEKEGRARKIVKAQQLWMTILTAQIETGTPYMLYKDACNSKSNQQNLGTIQSSNLCTEVVQYTSPDEIAVCNLASLNLSQFVSRDTRTFDHDKLRRVTNVVTRNLNKVIDHTFYPVEASRTSNQRHRPIGIGVQGLADVFCMLGMPYESEKARTLNRHIFETIYYGAVQASVDLAAEHGPYSTYEGSPASKGILQYDMWGVVPSERWDWGQLKEKLAVHGMRNSLLVAPMPTASTAQILGNNESFEAFTSNIYSRRTLAGEFVLVNKHLMKDLHKLGLWSTEMARDIMAHDGSVQHIEVIPPELRAVYKTVWEIKQRACLDMAADRGAFVCQSQSLNVHMAEPTMSKLTSMHFYAWKSGLKTGMYYLRTRPRANAVKFTVGGSSSGAAAATPERTNTGDSSDSSTDSSAASHSDDECSSCSA